MTLPSYWFVFMRAALFFTELFLVQNFFFLNFTKKKWYFLKEALIYLLGIGLCFFLGWCSFQVASSDTWAITITVACVEYFLLFAYIVVATYFLYKTRVYTLLFYSTASYAVQRMVFVLYLLILNLTNPELIIYSYVEITPLVVFLYILIFYGSLFLIYFLYIRKMTLIRKDETFGSSVIVMFTLAILINVVIGATIERYSTDLRFNVMYICSLILQIVCSFIIVFTQTSTLIQLRISHESKIIIDLLKEKEQEYQFAQTNAELISIKAHDLKHQVQALRAGGEQAEKVLSDLESVLQSYQSIITTGSYVIDVVLTQKWMFCEKNNIKLSINVDPDALKFMDDIDLYSIIGNVMDNAIEAVSKIEDEDKRVITLQISAHAGLSTITTNNYFTGSIKLRDGLPLTTKRDSSYHGFGMRSIKLVAQKYGGSLSVTTNDDIFILQITLYGSK